MKNVTNSLRLKILLLKLKFFLIVVIIQLLIFINFKYEDLLKFNLNKDDVLVNIILKGILLYSNGSSSETRIFHDFNKKILR